MERGKKAVPQSEKEKRKKNTALEQEEPVQPESETAQAEELFEKQTEQEALQKKYDELNDRNLRLMAEYDNFRKRSTREKDEAYGNATSAAVARFLPVLDNFDRAAGYDKAGEDFEKGFEMIYTGFCDVLKALGVEAFGEPGDAFDPILHHAVMHIEDETLGENVIAQVLQKGYRIGDRVVRCAMVQTAN